MDDLISREAAIKAVYYKPSHKMAIEVLKELPAVDAVPVEWLREKMNWADDNGEMDDVDCISWLIQTWQKEQEAQE